MLDIPGHDPQDVSYHVQLLHEAGLTEAQNLCTAGRFLGAEAYPLLAPPPHRIDEAHFQLISKGTTGAEVEAIFGVPVPVAQCGDRITVPRLDAPVHQTKQWVSRHGAFAVSLDERGRVADKHSGGETRIEFPWREWWLKLTRNFDDLDTSRAETVSFPADRYAKKHGIIITGDGGQYASRTFGFPDQYPSVSAPNIFAPGPMAHRNAGGGAAGGFRTDVTFTVGGEPAAVAGFAAVFIDRDHPDIGPSSLRVYDRLGKSLGEPRIVKGGNASQVFCGILAVDGGGNLVPAIGRVHLVNGRNWPGVSEGEGTALDDFVFGEPVLDQD